MPNIELIGFNHEFNDIFKEKFKEIFREKEYYRKIYTTSYYPPYASSRNLKTDKSAPFFRIVDDPDMKERAIDIKNEINKICPGFFIKVRYFDDSNL